MLRQGSSITQQISNQVAATGATLIDTAVLQEFDVDSVTFFLAVSQIAATTNTTNVYIQTQDAAGNWWDAGHFQQITASSATPYVLTCPVADNRYIGQLQATSIAASAIGVPLLSRAVRVVGLIGGSTPTTSYTLIAYYNHQSGRG